MEEETFDYLIQRITSTPITTHPYSHFHTEQIFPEEFYLELIDYIPDASYFSQFDTYPQRSSFELTKENLELLPFPYFLFWNKFAAHIGSLAFTKALFKKFQLEELFGEDLSLAKIGIDMSLVRDQPGYSIGPHTDHPNKVITLLFYLPSSHDQKHLGTSIYIPKDSSVKYNGHEHHSFQDFTKTSTVPFIPNSAFAFPRSNCSFHGVEPISEQEKERISLCYTIWR